MNDIIFNLFNIALVIFTRKGLNYDSNPRMPHSALSPNMKKQAVAKPNRVEWELQWSTEITLTTRSRSKKHVLTSRTIEESF